LLRSAACKRGGFTLIEALVALAVVLAFAAALGPYLFHARRVMSGIDDRIAAQFLLRSLLDAPLDRSRPPQAVREGKTAGLRWRVTAEPMAIEVVMPPRQSNPSNQNKNDPAPERPSWTQFRVIAAVSWSAGTSITAETIRLARVE
jgi:prepilin-type N-terminal cleavage/methylation domain-containing protein